MLPASGVAASPTVLLQEDFQDGQDQGWSHSGGGTVSVQNDASIGNADNKVYNLEGFHDSTQNLPAETFYDGSADWSDYEVEFDVKLHEWNAQVLFNFRFSDWNNYYDLAIRTGTGSWGYGGRFQFSQTVGGVWNSWWIGAPVEVGTWYHIKVSAIGDRIRLYFNGELKFDQAGFTLKKGKIGFWTISWPGDYPPASYGHIHIDNVKVGSPRIQKIAYIPVKYAGQSNADIPGTSNLTALSMTWLEWLEGTAQLVTDYYSQQSYGQEYLAYDFIFDDWEALPKTRAEYGGDDTETKRDIINDAIDMAKNKVGFDPDACDAVLVIQTDPSIRAGVPSLPGDRGIVSVRSDLRLNDSSIWAHELGHAIPDLHWSDYYNRDFWSLIGAEGYVGEWCLMGEGHGVDEPALIMSYNKEKPGWLEYETVNYGTYNVNMLMDLDYGDDVLRWDAGVFHTLFRYYILEGRRPPDGVIVDNRVGTIPSGLNLEEVEGVKLYGVQWPWSKIFSIPHDHNNDYRVTLGDGDSYPDDWNGVNFTARKEGSQWKVTISKLSLSGKTVFSLSGINITSGATGFLSCGEPPENPFDVDLQVFTKDGRKVGMDYGTGNYIVGIGGARTSGNILGGGPEWISVPDHEEVYFVIDPARAREWAEELGVANISIEAETAVISYDDAGQRAETEPVTVPLRLDKLVYGIETATHTGTAFFTSSDGNIVGLGAVAEGSLPPAAQATKPINFPDGLFSFNITGVSPGGMVTVTITLPTSAAPTQYWKYHASEGGWIQIPMTVVGPPNVTRITLQDGGLGDDDLTANGVIVDQGGPGGGAVGWETYPINKARVLLPWIALLSAIVAGACLLVVRRRGTRS
jgi:hypothetical protein